ncbi:MAG: MFS transporter [Candidatus Thorarchaeota archaeon]|nr:MAG: MFS transporter [Candidatus Thorarchaeota archaeon]
MHEQLEPFCLDDDEKPDMPESAKKRNRLVAYIATFLVTFTLGTTEIFAPWYIGALGGSGFEMCWSMGSFGIIYMISPALGGRFSDRVGRRKALIIATFAYILVLILFLNPFASPLYLIIIRALEGLVYGFIAPSNQAMLAELTPEAECEVLGNFSTAWSAGMIFSPFVLTFMVGNYGPASSIYVVIAIEFIMLGLIGGFLQSYRRKSSLVSSKELGDSNPLNEGTPSKTSPRFIASYLSIMLWGVISTVVLALFPAYVETLPGLTTSDWSTMLLVWNGVRTIAFIIIAKIPEKSMSSVILMGAILSAISSGVLFLFIDFWMLIIAIAISGIAVGLSYLGALYLIVSATKIEKGAYAGLVESMGGVGLFLGPIVGGWLNDFNGALPYLMCTIISIIVLVGIIPLLIRERNASKV